MQLEEFSNPLIYIPKYLKVLTKAAKHGGRNLVNMSFEMFPVQRHYIENKTNRDIVVKSRQVGFSTIVEALIAHKTFTMPYQNSSIIAHDEDTAMNLFTTFQRFYENLPQDKKPKSDWRSGLRMRFPALDSYIYIDGANSDHLGLGRSLSNAHLSEVAKWHPSKAELLFTEISQTVPEGGYLVMESTPHGRAGLFYKLYQAAKKGDIPYKAFFYPWWWDSTCHRSPKPGFVLTPQEKELKRFVTMTDKMELTDEQIAFRREKISEIGERYFEEYPENDIDCWLSTDISVFDAVAIRRYMQKTEPGREEGSLTVWKDAIGGQKYAIGVDVAGGLEHGDYSVAAVLNVKTNEYVARVRGRIPPDMFAEEVFRLGVRYNDAEVGVEKAQHGRLVLRTLLEKNYPNLYYYRDPNMFDDAMPPEPGWTTSLKTKPIMIADLQSAIRSGDLISWSANLMDECGNFMYDDTEGKKYKTAPGSHDDEIIAVAIGLQLRNQTPIMDGERYKPVRYVKL